MGSGRPPGSATGLALMTELSRRSLLRVAGLLSTTGVAGSAAGCASLLPRPTVRVAVTWSAGELEAFHRVLSGLRPRGYSVVPVPLGDNIAAALGAGRTGSPDVVMLPRPGLVAGHLRRMDPLPRAAAEPWPYADIWNDLVFRHGQLYGLPFKMAHKSAVWYRTDVFAEHGLRPPRTWSEWRTLNATLTRLGKTPLAVAGGDGWTLTDFFENVLLGLSPETYDALAAAHPPVLWTDPAVQRALRLLGRMWSQPGALAGGARRSLVLQFPDAVLEVFRYGRAAMVVAPDFAELVINRFATDLSTVGVFRFPAVDGDDDDAVRVDQPPPVVVGGDVAVLPASHGPYARDLVASLARPEAPLPWINPSDVPDTGDARRREPWGGFIAANLNTPRTEYSHQLGLLVAQLARQGTSRAESTFRFDLSDRLGAVGSLQGLWAVLQNFLRTIGNGGTSRVPGAARDSARRMRDFERRLIRDSDPRGAP